MIKPAAVIPAAGSSTRMEAFKPLLPLGDGTVLSQCIRLFHNTGVDRIIVVVGNRGQEVSEVASQAGAQPVLNQAYESGMFSSIRAGVNALDEDVPAFFVLPADMPMVKRETVTLLYEEYKRCKPDVLHPSIQGKRGHPPLIGRKLLPFVLNSNCDGGLRAVLRKKGIDSRDCSVPDSGIVHDLDHPEDYERAKLRWGKAYPDPEECRELLKMYKVSSHVQRHCKAVAHVAVALCNRLNERDCGIRLDVDLVRAAALTHDMGKGNKQHEAQGAKMLRKHGFYAAAEIVDSHFDLTLPPDAPITEKEIVFLADKLVRCDVPVNLETRYKEKMAAYSHEPGVEEAIRNRLERAESLLKRVDKEMGGSAEKSAREALGGADKERTTLNQG